MTEEQRTRHRALIQQLVDKMLTATTECEWHFNEPDAGTRARYYRMNFRQSLLRIEQLAKELGGDL